SPLDNQGTLTLHSYYNYLNGSVTTAAGSVMRVEGDAAPAYVVVANGFTNNGTLELTTINGASYASFADPGGTLVNAAAGTISIRTSATVRINYGTLTHDAGTLGGAGVLDLSNVTAGNFNVAHGLAELRLNNSTASFATDQSTATTTYTISGSTVNGPGRLM